MKVWTPVLLKNDLATHTTLKFWHLVLNEGVTSGPTVQQRCGLFSYKEDVASGTTVIVWLLVPQKVEKCGLRSDTEGVASGPTKKLWPLVLQRRCSFFPYMKV